MSEKSNSLYKGCGNYRERAWGECLVDFCSPTLAGLKCANMFVQSYQDEAEFTTEMQKLNKICNPKGVFVKALRNCNHKALLYVYRKNALGNVLKQEQIVGFLKGFGYEPGNVEKTLQQLEYRIKASDAFPHEIGIFLGYPYEDVKGFIDNAGQNFIFCGYWKVYADENYSRRLFRAFDSRRECYRRDYKKGIPVSKLLVAG